MLLLYLLAATLAAVAVAAELASGPFLPLLVLAGIGPVPVCRGGRSPWAGPRRAFHGDRAFSACAAQVTIRELYA